MKKNLTILAIDSTGHFSSVGIFDKIGNELFLTSYDCNFNELNSELTSKSISSLISGVINRNKKEKIDMIGITLGPGSFTKIRSSLSFAKGLALAHDLPILPIPTMQSLAYGLNKRKPSNGLFFSHGNNLFYQKYIWNDNIPNFDKKPILEEGNKILKKINTKENTFHWNCSRYVKDIKNIIPISPSAKLVGLLGGLLFDQILEEKPYQLEPEYIAPFKVGTHK